MLGPARIRVSSDKHAILSNPLKHESIFRSHSTCPEDVSGYIVRAQLGSYVDAVRPSERATLDIRALGLRPETHQPNPNC